MAARRGKQVEADDPPSIPQVQEEPQGPANVAPITRTVVQRRREAAGAGENRGGYECAFVHPPPHTQTECSICLLVLRSPHLASCCGQNFCKECIERVQKAGKCCPLCKETFILTYNRAHDVSLQQFEVYCPHRKIGCEWRGKLEILDTHLNVNPKLDKQLEGCAFAEVQCFNDGCGQYFQRPLIVQHQCSECPLRVFSCEHCHEYESTYHDVTINHWPVCKCYPLPCPHECRQETIQRQNLEQHLNEECPLQEVECEFKYAGCEAKLSRKDMPDHLRDYVGHMTLLARQNQTLAQQNQELMTKLLEKDEQLQQMMEHNRREVEETIVNLKEELRTRLADRDEQIEEQQTMIRRELGNLMHKQEATNGSLKELQGSTAPAAEVGTLKNQLRDVVRKQDTVASTVEKLYHHVYTAPVQIVMSNYEQCKRANDMWYSNGFYTHPQGYKMCLVVYANGYDDGEGTHVSCYIFLMRGEFDNHLRWPFRGAITITVLNQREDYDHCNVPIDFDDETPDKYTEQVTSGEDADNGWGYSQFIPHSELGHKPATNCQYLVNDCLHFRVKFKTL